MEPLNSRSLEQFDEAELANRGSGRLRALPPRPFPALPPSGARQGAARGEEVAGGGHLWGAHLRGASGRRRPLGRGL